MIWKGNERQLSPCLQKEIVPRLQREQKLRSEQWNRTNQIAPVWASSRITITTNTIMKLFFLERTLTDRISNIDQFEKAGILFQSKHMTVKSNTVQLMLKWVMAKCKNDN